MAVSNLFKGFGARGTKKSKSRRGIALAVTEVLEDRRLMADITGTYTWAPVAIGAGGWADGIISSQSNANVRFVRDDTGQADRWDATLNSWEPMIVQNVTSGGVTGFPTSVISDPSQGTAPQVASFALDPNNNSTLYVYVQFGSTGGPGLFYNSLPYNVYKSTDGGKNFTATHFSSNAGFTYTPGNGSTWVSDTMPNDFRYDGERMAVDPNNSNVVYIGTGNKGLYRSINGGTDWSLMTGTGLPSGVDDMNIIPYAAGGTVSVSGTTVSKVLYLNSENGIYLSTNGGQNWSNIGSGVSRPGQGEIFRGATLDPNTGSLFVPTNYQVLWKYNYSTSTWTQAQSSNAGLVAVDPNNSNNMVVYSGGGHLRRSTDGGATWTDLGAVTFTNAQGFSGDTANPNKFISASKLLVDSTGKVWMVEGNDGIITWQFSATAAQAVWTPSVTGFENFAGIDVALPANDGGKAIVSVSDNNGLLLNGLNNYNVKLLNPNTTSALSEGSSIAVCPTDPNTFAIESYDYLLKQSQGTLNDSISLTGITTDGGQTYTLFSNISSLPLDLYNTEGTNLAISARGSWSAGSDHIVWLGTDGIPWYSTNGGSTWTESASFSGLTLRTNNTHYFTDRELLADPSTPNKFYLYYDEVKSGSNDVSPYFVSTDGGATWTHGNAPTGNPVGHELMADNTVTNGNAGLWLQTLGNGLFHSTDGGTTWTQVKGNGNLQLNGASIAIGKGDGVTGDASYTLYYLYANNGQGRYSPALDYGVYRSVNGGASWDKIANWPDGMIIDGDVEDSYSMMAASWDTFGEIVVANSGSGFIYGMPSQTGGGGSGINWTSENAPDANTLALYHFDETSGSTAVNAQGNTSRNLTLASSSMITNGTDFLGRNSYFLNTSFGQATSAAQAIPTDWNSDLTIDFWMKTTAVSNQTYAPVMISNGLGWNNEATFSYNPTFTDPYRPKMANVQGTYGGSPTGIQSTLLNGAWHNVAITHQASTATARLYVDNVLLYSWNDGGGTNLAAGAEVYVGNGLSGVNMYVDELLIEKAQITNFANAWNAPVNHPPVAVNDSYSTNENQPLVVSAPGLLANDTDADNDPLTAIKVTDPSHGTVTLNSNGSFTYTPSTGWYGADSFTYKANDGKADSNIATAAITVNQYTGSGILWTSENVADANTLALYHFDESSGTTAVNAQGNTSHNLTLSSSSMITNGTDFLGHNSYFLNTSFGQATSAAQAIPTDWTSDLTIDFWMKTTAVAAQNYSPVMISNGLGWNNEATFTYNPTFTDPYRPKMANVQGTFGGNPSGIQSLLLNGQWHNVAITHQASTATARLYVDNVMLFSWNDGGGTNLAAGAQVYVGNSLSGVNLYVDELLIEKAQITNFANAWNAPMNPQSLFATDVFVPGDVTGSTSSTSSPAVVPNTVDDTGNDVLHMTKRRPKVYRP